VTWLVASAVGHVRLRAGRRAADESRELREWRRLRPLLTVEHASFLLVLISGFALMRALGWPASHGRWLGVKLGLTALLLLPLEGMHAWVVHVWIARGLRETETPPFSRTLERAIGMEEMLRAIALPLLALAVPLLVWLSVAKPF
jgi:hypothetical protein